MSENEETVCKYCGKPTLLSYTEKCDPCWELERCIGAAPELAKKILEDKMQLPPRRPATKLEVEAVGAICNLKKELEEARRIIRSLLDTPLGGEEEKDAIRFLHNKEV